MKSFLFFILIAPSLCIAKINVSYFPFQSFLGLHSNTDRGLWLDLKIETNSFASNLNMEISPKCNLKMNMSRQTYFGIGVSLNPSRYFASGKLRNGYFIDYGIRVKPLRTERRFQIVFEISPYVNADLNGGNLRSRLGIAWNFKTPTVSVRKSDKPLVP